MNANLDRVLTSLPEFPDTDRREWNSLRIDGLVYYPVTLSFDDVELLPRHGLKQDFHCEEGWTVPGQRWEGARLAHVIQLSEPMPEAQYVAFSAGDFTACLSLEEVLTADALLALRLNGEPIPQEHGGPCRLIVSDKTCYFNIKWIDRIRLLTERPVETGKALALERIRART